MINLIITINMNIKKIDYYYNLWYINFLKIILNSMSNDYNSSYFQERLIRSGEYRWTIDIVRLVQQNIKDEMLYLKRLLKQYI